MFDIGFYRKWKLGIDPETIRNKNPIVYNIETTNACNMRCKMCPRTTLMTRPVKTIDFSLFKKVIDQLKPFTFQEWDEWREWAHKRYGISPFEMSENHFFLYVIPKVIQLHGYGDPMLDPNIDNFVDILTDRGFYSYFSCNPANIDIWKTEMLFDAGLDYIKYSIESTDDREHKDIRGNASNFTDSYQKILKLLEIKRKAKYHTTIVITMLDLNRDNQQEEWEKLKKAFESKDVYIYLKSEDTQWYRKDYHGTNSIHWSEPCRHPWMSMTIKSDGKVAMCMEDYNNEIVLGDAATESLYDIWNGRLYKEFRLKHLSGEKGIRCTDNCDMKVIGHENRR